MFVRGEAEVEVAPWLCKFYQIWSEKFLLMSRVLGHTQSADVLLAVRAVELVFTSGVETATRV